MAGFDDTYNDPISNDGYPTVQVPRDKVLKYRIASNEFIEVGIHFIQDTEGKTTVEYCLNQEWSKEDNYNRKIVDHDCPMCKVAKDTGNERMSVTRIFPMNAIIRNFNGECSIKDDSKEDVVKIFEAKKTVLDSIMKHALDDEWPAITQIEFKSTKTGKGFKTTYETKASPKTAPLTDEEKELIEEGKKDLLAHYKPKSAEEIKKIMGLDVDDGFDKDAETPDDKGGEEEEKNEFDNELDF